MGFSWMSITKERTNIRKAQVNEVVQNIMDLEGTLQLGEVPPGSKHDWSSGGGILSGENPISLDIESIRTAVDNLDNYNYCRSHNGTHFLTHYNTHLYTEKGSNFLTHLGTHYYQHRGSNNGQDWSSQKNTHRDGANTSQMSADRSSVEGVNRIGQKASNLGSEKSGY
jgi:hypothetical protein